MRQRRQIPARPQRAMFGHDRRELGVEEREQLPRATTGRAPDRPIASVRARRNIIARTTSGSTAGPIPAAWERTSARCSSARRSAGNAHRGQRAEARGDAVGGLTGVSELRDHGGGGLHRRARIRAQGHRNVSSRYGDYRGRGDALGPQLDGFDLGVRHRPVVGDSHLRSSRYGTRCPRHSARGAEKIKSHNCLQSFGWPARLYFERRPMGFSGAERLGFGVQAIR